MAILLRIIHIAQLSASAMEYHLLMTKTNNEENTLTRDQVLSLDIATHCGFYSTKAAGTWNFSQSTAKNAMSQYEVFYDTLKHFILTHDIKQIVAEDVNVRGQFIAMRKLSEFRGILCLVCSQLHLPQPTFVNVTTIKKWATGDGKADKKKMIKFCKERWGIDPVDDNMADATHIFKYYVRKYNL